MNIKALKNVFTSSHHSRSSTPMSSPKHSGSSHHSRPSTPIGSPLRTFSSALMEDNISSAESIINKWDVDSPSVSYTKVTSLFYQDDDRSEALRFINTVKDLQRSMHFFISDRSSPDSHSLIVTAQKLMESAMKRLQKEFHQILSVNRDRLDPESVSARSSLTSFSSLDDLQSDFGDEIEGSDDEIRPGGDSMTESPVPIQAESDLRSIAKCMISAGYGKECTKIYRILRRSIVDESLYRLGIERLTASQVHKMDCDLLEIRVRSWIPASKTALRTLFRAERILCDRVFADAPESVRESCFAAVSGEPATAMFSFAESVATSKFKKSPEKMFRFLDMYESISDHWEDIQSTFSYESSSAVRSQATSALLKLAEAIRSSLSELESAIQKDTSKSTVPGGGLHPLTSYVMNYLAFLADYSRSLGDILADYPIQVRAPLPESVLHSATSSPTNGCDENLSMRVAWIILVLLCKLDGKAVIYKDVALSYVFLANNLNYVVGKVKGTNLKEMLGNEWVTNHEGKVRQYAANYERVGWSKVVSSMPTPLDGGDRTVEEVGKVFRRFNEAFEEAYMMHATWVIPDGRMRDEIKVSISRKVVPMYRKWYEAYRGRVAGVVRFAPEDLGNRLSDLFYGTDFSGSGSVSVSGHLKGSRSSR
ncbi:hypothetical protein QJS10_CPA03g01437 [Acorus calamus]|uniref:Exocyst subunit Exo70 family protein n=1 Tax=Acorus calamus TaxID=4465 RepID=A0AAV9F6K7_ACOCL|nr:hypothetical protein QJS10_CPA03g01437 [Acorus calamus]